MSHSVINTDKAPAAIGPYVQAVGLGNLVFTSGQLGIDMSTGDLAEGVELQAEFALKNIGEILAAVGLSYNHIVKTTVFLQNIDDFARVNEVYARFFPESKPARSCVAVAALPKAALVEIECIASL